MDESVFSSPLETNLNRLIFDQFSHWQTQFKQFLSFTDLVKELEEGRSKSFAKVKSENLPSNCVQWMKTTSNSSADFVVLFSEDFRPKLAKELEEIEEEQGEALKCLKEAQDTVKEVSEVILKNLNELLIYFKRKEKRNLTTDPWINELTIRHFSAKFLDRKSEYLITLYRIYTQIRNLHTELNHKLAVYSDEFLRILERFGLAAVDEKSPQIDFANFNISTKQRKETNSQWESVLRNYSLDYEWKLTCPPLDGFLSSLYTQLKSLGADFSLETGGNVPKIFSENFLRTGFLQKLISGLLTRNWQVNFAILQPTTGFLHLYKVNKGGAISSGTEGNLLVPTPGNSYTKSSLQDLNVLATQFYLQSPHQPASISPQTLTPFLSIPIGPNCKVAASDPNTFVFLIKPPGGDKVNLKAFCEEEFVDWVIFLNETVKRTKPNSISNSPKTKSESPSSSTSSENSNSPKLQIEQAVSEHESENEILQENTANSSSFPSVTPIVDLENPWE